MYDNQKLSGGLKFSLSLLGSPSLLLLILCSLLTITIILCIPKQAAAHTITPIHTSTISPANIVHFLKYENSTYGIKMQYPSNWQKIESKGSHEKGNHNNDKSIVEFRLSPSLSAGNPSIDRSTLKISIHKLPSQNIIVNLFTFFDKTPPQRISLEGFVLSHVTILLTTLPNFHLIRSESGETALADNTPAYKLVYEYREQGQKNILAKSMEILMVKDDTGYMIRYISEEPKYSDYLPIVQQMVNSVEISR
jgi:hypothetical protein